MRRASPRTLGHGKAAEPTGGLTWSTQRSSRRKCSRSIERQRAYLEWLYARCVELDCPKDDHFRNHAAFAVVAQRKLCLVVNEGRQKGVYRRYLRRSRFWPKVEV
jgi:hypothetical protein